LAQSIPRGFAAGAAVEEGSARPAGFPIPKPVLSGEAAIGLAALVVAGAPSFRPAAPVCGAAKPVAAGLAPKPPKPGADVVAAVEAGAVAVDGAGKPPIPAGLVPNPPNPPGAAVAAGGAAAEAVDVGNPPKAGAAVAGLVPKPLKPAGAPPGAGDENPPSVGTVVVVAGFAPNPPKPPGAVVVAGAVVAGFAPKPPKPPGAVVVAGAGDGNPPNPLGAAVAVLAPNPPNVAVGVAVPAAGKPPAAGAAPGGFVPKPNAGAAVVAGFARPKPPVLVVLPAKLNPITAVPESDQVQLCSNPKLLPSASTALPLMLFLFVWLARKKGTKITKA
jgi:hypothetical protein